MFYSHLDDVSSGSRIMDVYQPSYSTTRYRIVSLVMEQKDMDDAEDE